VELYHTTIPAIPPLIELLKDQNPGVRSAALLKLAKLAEYGAFLLEIIIS
jgi:HEAT repeat protein